MELDTVTLPQGIKDTVVYLNKRLDPWGVAITDIELAEEDPFTGSGEGGYDLFADSDELRVQLRLSSNAENITNAKRDQIADELLTQVAQTEAQFSTIH